MEQQCIYCKQNEEQITFWKMKYDVLYKLYKKRFDVLGCFRKVSSNSMAGKKKKNMELFKKKINQNEISKQHFIEIKNWINQLPPNTSFKVKELIEVFHTKSLGDMQRKILDYFVCTGELTKTEFSMGKKGHVFQKPQTPTKCIYLSKDGNGNEYCGCNEWVVLGKKKETE